MKIMSALSQRGLTASDICMADFHEGVEPRDFLELTGAGYKPSFSEEPSIAAQC